MRTAPLALCLLPLLLLLHQSSALSQIGGRLPGTDSCPICVDDEGSNDKKCHMNGPCICRNSGEVCYKDSPVHFDVYFSILLVEFLYHSIMGIVFLVDIAKVHLDSNNDKKKGLSPMDKVCLMASVGALFRLMWVVLQFNGVNGSVFPGGPALKGFLLKVPQILWMGSFFYVSLVWRDLEEQLVSLKRATLAGAQKNDRLANGMNLFLSLGIIPLYLAGLILPADWIIQCVDAVQALIVIFLCGGGLYTGLRLSKSLKGNEKAATVVSVIESSIAIGIVGALVAVGGVAFQLAYVVPTAGDDFTMLKAYGEFYMVHHVGEFLIVISLFETKRRQYFAKGGKLISKATKVVTSGIRTTAKSISGGKRSTKYEDAVTEISRDSDVESVSNPMSSAKEYSQSDSEKAEFGATSNKTLYAGGRESDVAL